MPEEKPKIYFHTMPIIPTRTVLEGDLFPKLVVIDSARLVPTGKVIQTPERTKPVGRVVLAITGRNFRGLKLFYDSIIDISELARDLGIDENSLSYRRLSGKEVLAWSFEITPPYGLSAVYDGWQRDRRKMPEQVINELIPF